MKNWFSLLCLGLLAGYACKQETVDLLPPPPGHVILRSGTSVVTPVGVTVVADSVWTSICPKEASCFAPDNVAAKFRLVKGQAEQRVSLLAFFGNTTRRTSNDSDSVSVTLGGQLYKVILRGEYRDETTPDKGGRALVEVAPL